MMTKIMVSDEVSSLVEECAALTRNKITNLKRLGNPAIGWFSVYTPEEIIYASGITSFRITGEEAVSSMHSRALMFTNLCPYTLSCLEEGLQGVYNFLDGVTIVNTCDVRRRLYDAWRRYVKTSFCHIIDLPRTVSQESKSYFKNQLTLFKKAIEEQFKRKITDSSLREAISVWNETRSLLTKLYDLRKNIKVPISGAEVLTIVKASMAGDKKHFNEILSRLLKEIAASPDRFNHRRQRVLITGSYFDQTSLVELIEETGAIVVCEDLSNGLKYFEGLVDLTKEPIEALAEYYLEKAPCARMVDSERRYDHILRLTSQFKIDAVVYFTLKFCDSNLIDFPYQRQRLSQLGIPVLFLEGERASVNLNQLKTRIEAFLEMGVDI